MPDSTTIVAATGLAVAFIGYLGVRYRTNGRTVRQEIKELRAANEEFKKEIDNLKLQLSPNPTATIWLDQKEEIIGYNGAAVSRIFTRIGRTGSEVTGKHISQVLGMNDFVLARNALNSPSQVAKERDLIIDGKISTDIAVAYVVYNSSRNDAVVELQFIL